MLTMTNRIARQSPPVAKYAPIGAGKVHGGYTNIKCTQPALNTSQVTVVIKIGANTKGTKNIGFSMIGNPKITGSLILKMLGIRQARLMALV